MEGVLHDYLGASSVPGSDEIFHVFARREWLPDIGEQPPITLVRPEDPDPSVRLIHRSAPLWALVGAVSLRSGLWCASR